MFGSRGFAFGKVENLIVTKNATCSVNYRWRTSAIRWRLILWARLTTRRSNVDYRCKQAQIVTPRGTARRPGALAAATVRRLEGASGDNDDVWLPRGGGRSSISQRLVCHPHRLAGL